MFEDCPGWDSLPIYRNLEMCPSYGVERKAFVLSGSSKLREDADSQYGYELNYTPEAATASTSWSDPPIDTTWSALLEKTLISFAM